MNKIYDELNALAKFSVFVSRARGEFDPNKRNTLQQAERNNTPPLCTNPTEMILANFAMKRVKVK